MSPCRSKLYDVSRLDAPFAFTFLELHCLAFVQRAKTRTLDLRVVHEHFVSVLAGETPYEPPTDQVTLHRVVEAIYRAAEEGKEIRL